MFSMFDLFKLLNTFIVHKIEFTHLEDDKVNIVYYANMYVLLVDVINCIDVVDTDSVIDKLKLSYINNDAASGLLAILYKNKAKKV